MLWAIDEESELTLFKRVLILFLIHLWLIYYSFFSLIISNISFILVVFCLFYELFFAFFALCWG